MKAFALGLALKQKRKATRKTPIEPVNTAASHRAPSESAERSVSRARTTDEALFVGFVFSRGTRKAPDVRRLYSKADLENFR